jgi:hypothetical protein
VSLVAVLIEVRLIQVVPVSMAEVQVAEVKMDGVCVGIPVGKVRMRVVVWGICVVVVLAHREYPIGAYGPGSDSVATIAGDRMEESGWCGPQITGDVLCTPHAPLHVAAF